MIERTFIRKFLVLMSGTIIAQAIPLLIAPILSRTYSPENFGMFAIFTTFSGLLATVFSLKYDVPLLTVVNSRNVKKILDFCTLSVFILFVFLTILTLVLFYLFEFKADYLLVPICALFLSGIAILDKVFNKYEQYRLMSLQRVVKNVIEAVCNLSVAFKMTNFFSLTTSFVFGCFGAFIFSYVNSLAYFKGFFSRFNLKDIKETYFNYSSYRRYTLPHTIINQITDNIFVFFIPLLFSQKSLGLLVFGLRLFQTPLGFVSSSLYNILSQQFTNYTSKGIKLKLLKVFKLMCIAALLVFPLSYFLPDIFIILFGDSWAMSGEILRLLTPWILLGSIVSTFAFIPIYSNLQKKAFYFELVNSACKIIPFFLAYFFNLEFFETLEIFALLATIYIIIASMWIYSLILKIK